MKRRKSTSHWTRLGRSMLPSSMSDESRRRLRRRSIAAGVALLLVWLTFFDSHSLFRRFMWYGEYNALTEENLALQKEIERLDAEVDQGLSDEMVEKIAREHYGMHRPGETVYRVEDDD